MPRQSKYSPQFKANAIQLWRTSGRSQRSVAAELGISNELLRQWIRRAQGDDSGEPPASPSTITDPERAELRQLRAEVKTLQMERDVLIRAANLIAKDNAAHTEAASLARLERSRP
jgi:transposase